MKKLYTIILLSFLGLSTKVNAQIVNIPDANFNAALIANGVNDSAGYITVNIAKNFTNPLNLNSKNIADMTGIEAFVAITYLSCDSNLLDTLNVSFNTALTHLSCNNNTITGLYLLSNPALTYVDCGFNYFISILNLTINTALDTLICNDNNLASLDLSSNTALSYFYGNDNYYTTLDVSHNTALTYLSSDYGVLTSLDVSHNTALTYLDCGFNPIPTLDASANTALTYLQCSGDSLTSLNLSSNHALIHLESYYNSLTSLDLSSCPALTYLDCDYDSLSSLNLAHNTLLDTLLCFQNHFTSLDLSHDTALAYVDCSENQITNLDLSSNKDLVGLYCTTNTLSGLNVKNGNNHNMQSNGFEATYNPSLTCIEVDNVAYSIANWTSKDSWASFSTYCATPCSADFTLQADTANPHHYIATNLASGVPPVKYVWSWGDGNYDSIPFPSHTYADSGFYTICLTITDSTGCQSTFCDSSFHLMRTTDYMVYISVVAPIITGTEEAGMQTPNISIYPNPVRDELTIETNGSKPVSIKLYNVLSEIIYSNNPTNNMETIDINSEPQGIYFIQIIDADKNIITKKIIKL